MIWRRGLRTWTAAELDTVGEWLFRRWRALHGYSEWGGWDMGESEGQFTWA